MADLVVLGFKDRATAEQVWELGAAMQQQELVDLADAALVWRDDNGKVRIQQAVPTTATGAASGLAGGALWGTLIGLLFLNPLAGFGVGALAGGAAGALSGALTDIGVNDDFIRQVGETLAPGTAAVFALVRRSTTDKVAANLKPYEPTVIHTSLSSDSEEELVRALQGSPSAT